MYGVIARSVFVYKKKNFNKKLKFFEYEKKSGTIYPRFFGIFTLFISVYAYLWLYAQKDGRICPEFGIYFWVIVGWKKCMLKQMA